MESNLPVLSKSVCNIVRVAFFMLRKGFPKGKLLTDLNLMLKRPGKFAGKAIANLISHHHHCHHGGSTTNHNAHLQFSTAREYEFRCSDTPKYSFFSKRHIPRHFFACGHAPLTLDNDAAAVNNALKGALEMLDNKKCKDVVEVSPALPGSGRTQTVRQLRLTDSPFPVQDGNGDCDGDHQVDKAADEFIERFFMELRKQG